MGCRGTTRDTSLRARAVTAPKPKGMRVERKPQQEPRKKEHFLEKTALMGERNKSLDLTILPQASCTLFPRTDSSGGPEGKGTCDLSSGRQRTVGPMEDIGYIGCL